MPRATPRNAGRSTRRYLEDFDRFVRDYTGGVRAEDFRRLFDRDATAAYRVLARDREEAEPEDEFRRFLHRARIVFLGLSYKLTPARRLLFLACLFFAFLGLMDYAPSLRAGSVVIDASPLWFLVSIGGLCFLLMLALVDQVRVRDELEVARQLQRDLLPRRVPELGSYRIAHSYRTANEVGGDYYDFVLLPSGRLAVMVGDASGHGMAAGLLMAIANATLRLAMDLDPRPEPVLLLLNRSLCRTGDRRAFMSMFYSLLEPESGELEYACAGHPFPLLRRADGSIEELGLGGLPLGLREDIAPAAKTVTLSEGDTLLLYSDGLPEAVNAEVLDFGYERLRALLLEGGTVEQIHERVRSALDRHLGNQPLADDFCLVVLSRNSGVPTAVPPPPPPAV